MALNFQEFEDWIQDFPGTAERERGQPFPPEAQRQLSLVFFTFPPQ